MNRKQSRFTIGTRVPGRSWWKIFWWDACSALCLAWLRLFYKVKLIGFEKIPATGPLVFISNHQSYYDPMLNGIGVNNRQFTAIASGHLARFKPLKWLLRSFGSVFVSASTGDKGPLRAALGELEAGRCVLIYPEGSRCEDGLVAPLQRGMLLLMKKSSATVIPMAVEGAFDVWPRQRKLPRLGGHIAVVCGEPRTTEDVLEGGPEAALANMRRELDDLRLEARSYIRKHSDGRFPKPGLPDGPSDP